MRRKGITIIVAVALALMSGSYSYASTKGRATGIVKSTDEKPIPGAKVTLEKIDGSGTGHYEFTTDKKGKWAKIVAPGIWRITCEAEGYKTEVAQIPVSAVRENPFFEMTLVPVPDAPFKEGDALYEEEKYQEALLEYQKVLAEKPELFAAYEKIGLCYYQLRDLDHAIEAFTLMLDNDPQAMNSIFNLSAIYFEKGDLEQGMKYLNQVDEKSITDKAVFYNAANLLFNSGQIDMAIDYFSKCLDLDPTFVDGYYQLALTLLNKGDMEGARKNFQKIIDIAPESPKAELAQTLLDQIQ